MAARYYDDIQAHINTLDPNDPIIPYLYAERREKINAQAEQRAAQMAAASEAEKEAWNRAFKAFQEVGRITSAEQAQILGLPPNATVADVDIARINAETARINATKPTEPKEEKYDYNTDPNFQAEVADIVSGRATLADVTAHAAELQEAYGYDGYMELYRRAAEREE